MSQLVYDHTQLVEPNLLIPGKKPVGPVKIDWEHTLTEGLISAVKFGPKNVIDLVTGKRLNYCSGGTIDCLDFNADYLGTEERRRSVAYDTDLFNGLESFSIVAVISRNWASSSSNEDNIVGCWVGNQVLFRYDSANSQLDLYVNTSSTTSISPSLTLNLHEITTLTATYDGAYIRLYANGILLDSTALTGSIPSGNYTGWGGPYNVNSDGGRWRYYFGSIYNRALSQIEISSLSFDKYQFLIPAG